MTWQEVIDLLDEETQKSIGKLIAGSKDDHERYKAEISAYRRLKDRIKNKVKKEAESHGKAGMA